MANNEKTKHEIANEYVNKAIIALIAAIKEDILEIGKKRMTINTISSEYGEEVEETWKVSVKGDNITFSNDRKEKYQIEELTISTLIDISNAFLTDNYEY
jgi:hypothetical protein